MKNWKTAVSGFVTAAFGFVLFSPDLFHSFPWLIELSKYAMVGGLISLGVTAKDYSTHSTAAEVQQSTNQADAEARKGVE